MKPRAGDRSETPLLPALLPFLLFHPWSSSLQPFRFFFHRRRMKKRRAGGSVGIPLPTSHGGSHRLINQTPRTNRYGDPTAVPSSKFSSYPPSYSSAFALPALVSLHDSCHRPSTRVFLFSSCTLVGIMRRFEKKQRFCSTFLTLR